MVIKEDIDFKLLGEEMSEMLSPLFEEIENGEEIKKTDFIDACYNLFDAFHIPGKNLNILNFGKPKKQSNEDKMLAKIAENIKEIENKYINNEDHAPIWERLHNQKKLDDQNIKRIQLDQIRDQMKECTFFPMKVERKLKYAMSQPSLNRVLRNAANG